MTLSNTQVLKDPKLTDAIQIWVWGLSANNGGEIKKSNISFNEKEEPYIDLNVSGLPEDVVKFHESFKKFLLTAIKGPETCQDLLTQGKDLQTQGQGKKSLKIELCKDVKTKAQDASLSMGDTYWLILSRIKAGTNCTKNMKTLTTGLAKFQNVAQAITGCGNELKDTVPKIKSMIDNADEIGKKASEEGKVSMASLMDYHEGEKKTAEEMNGVARKAK